MLLSLARRAPAARGRWPSLHAATSNDGRPAQVRSESGGRSTWWEVQWQPFVPWVHEETDYMGERDMRGTVRDAKDAQRVYNVYVSSLSESVNDAPKNRVVGYKGQFGKPDSMTRRGWETAPNKRFAYLEVEPITIDGKPAPFPQPFNVEPAIMGLAHAISQADNDLKATGRFHDASLAEAGPEQSGKAIIARQRQDDLSNGGFINGPPRRAVVSLSAAHRAVPCALHDGSDRAHHRGRRPEAQGHDLQRGGERPPPAGRLSAGRGAVGRGLLRHRVRGVRRRSEAWPTGWLLAHRCSPVQLTF